MTGSIVPWAIAPVRDRAATGGEGTELIKYSCSAQDRNRREGQLAKARQDAADRGRPLAQLALEYVSGIEGVSVTLLGVRSVDQLRGLLGHIRTAESPRAHD